MFLCVAKQTVHQVRPPSQQFVVRVKKEKKKPLLILRKFLPLVNMSCSFLKGRQHVDPTFPSVSPPVVWYRQFFLSSQATDKKQKKKRKREQPLCPPQPLTPAPGSAAPPQASGPSGGSECVFRSGVLVCPGIWRTCFPIRLVPLLRSFSPSLSLGQPGLRLPSASPGGHSRHFTVATEDQNCQTHNYII